MCVKGERGFKKNNSEVRVFQISCTYISKMFFVVRSERFTRTIQRGGEIIYYEEGDILFIDTDPAV